MYYILYVRHALPPLLSTVEAVFDLQVQHQIRDSSNPDLAVDIAMLNILLSSLLVRH